jgi:hypothetical protein
MHGLQWCQHSKPAGSQTYSHQPTWRTICPHCSSFITHDSFMVVLARQNGQLKKEIKKRKKDFQKLISD